MGETAVSTIFEGVTVEDAAEEARQDELHEPTNPPRSRQRRIASAAVVVAAVFFVLAVAMALLAVSASRRNTASETERDNVRAVAAEVTDAIIGFDHQHPNANRARLNKVAAPRVLDAYDKELPVTKQLGGKTGGTIAVTVRGVYTSEIQDGRAVALVQSDLKISSKKQTTGIENLYTRVMLRNDTGRWIADNVQTLVDVGGLRNTTR